MAVGDEWIACNGWRMHKLDDFLLYKNTNTTSTVVPRKTAAQVKTPPNAITVSRDKRLLDLQMPTPEANAQLLWSLRVQSAAKVDAWLEAA